MTTPRQRRAFVVVDLGFGDSGKGLLTDFLVRRTGAKLVVRYNGGAQAGHNVVTDDGRHHTFAQFGAGTFVPSVRTFLSHEVVVHPTGLLAEAAALEQKGVADALSRIAVSERARIITPYHQATNRLRELERGESRHGSCGVGVGETVCDAAEWPDDAVYAADLRDVTRLRHKLARIRARKHAEMSALWGGAPAAAQVERELQIFVRDEIANLWIERARTLATLGIIAPDATLSRWAEASDSIVCEGAQGVLLDEAYGFHPHTTWSRCTAEPAIELLDGSHAEIIRVGVLRSHAMRHGAGPLPTETEELRAHVLDHNRENDWQGPVRYGWFDAVLVRYALAVIRNVDLLAITHLDLLRELRTWKWCAAYRDGPTQLPIPTGLNDQMRCTQTLERAIPNLEECAPDEALVVDRIEQLLGAHVAILSRGPQAAEVTVRAPVQWGR